MAAISETILKGLSFISRQEKSFKTNMLRAVSQYFLRTLALQYQSVYIVALGATAFQLGAVNSVGGLSAAAIAVPIGWLADKYTKKDIIGRDAHDGFWSFTLRVSPKLDDDNSGIIDCQSCSERIDDGLPRSVW